MYRITKDYLVKPDVGDSAVGFESNRCPLYGIERIMGVDDDLPDTPDLPLVKFRLYDDDGVLCYEGECHDDPDCANQSAVLRWGETDSGCTEIRVQREEGKWTTEIG